MAAFPLSSAQQKPTRQEALEYYRKVAEYYRLDVRQYHTVSRIEGADGAFLVHCTICSAAPPSFSPANWWSPPATTTCPTASACPGEDLPKVTHYYREPHPYNGSMWWWLGRRIRQRSPPWSYGVTEHASPWCIAAPRISPNVKYWIKPDIENRIKNHEIAAYFNTSVREITPDSILIDTPQGKLRMENDFVLAMTGYHPDFDFLRALGVELSSSVPASPWWTPQTLESNVAGIYLAGVIIAGMNTSEIFIENGRYHGRQIAEDLRHKLGVPTTEPFIPEHARRAAAVVAPPAHLRNTE